ncbi:hypothetical protein L195_g058689, partial [Trifolium pratense]
MPLYNVAKQAEPQLYPLIVCGSSNSGRCIRRISLVGFAGISLRYSSSHDSLTEYPDRPLDGGTTPNSRGKSVSHMLLEVP